jgi:hypothetical protein
MRKAPVLGIGLAAALALIGPASAAVAHRPHAVARHHKPATGPAARPTPDGRTAATVARSLVTTGGGTATWVRARGKAVTAAMFPGEPAIFGDAQPTIDEADLIVVFTADHVSNTYPHPPGFTPPPAVGAGAIADARTGQVLTTSVFSTAAQADAWTTHLADLGTVRRVAVPQ